MHVRELFDLNGKAALVTGGGRGIGRHVALGLAEAGADVFVVSRKLEACREAAAQIEKIGHRATPVAADVSDPASIDALVAQVHGQVDQLDVLVNCAARVWASPILEYPLEGWDKVFDLNVRGLFYLSQQVAARMVAGGRGGSIIHIGSISAWRGAPDDEQAVIAYNASKGAVASLTTDMAVKLAPHGIRMNSIAPGPFLTDMMNHLRSEEGRLREYEASLPLGRSGGEDDIKGAAVFLVIDAAAFVTGHTLVVDGGMLCASPAI